MYVKAIVKPSSDAIRHMAAQLGLGSHKEMEGAALSHIKTLAEYRVTGLALLGQEDPNVGELIKRIETYLSPDKPKNPPKAYLIR